MTATTIQSPQIVMLAGNGTPLNTTVMDAPCQEAFHGLESDPDLYTKVITRVHTQGDTVDLDEALLHLDDHAGA